jgi:hypothetical protein
MVDSTRRVAGYYTLSAYGIRVAELAPGVARKVLRYPLIPATFLGRLAVSWEFQGQKLGRLLLMNPLRRSWRNSAEVA